MEDAKRKALSEITRDYQGARLGSRLPKDKRPKISISFGEAEMEPEVEIGEAEILDDESEE